MSNEKEYKLPEFSNIRDNMPELNKSIENKEKIQLRIHQCSEELQEALKKYNSAISIIPQIAPDENGRLRVIQQIYVRFIENV